MNEIRCIVKGKVQQVSYRVYIEEKAKAFELTGWVANHRDGTVEVVAQGITDSLKAFVEELHEGSVLAHVESVATDWHTAKETYYDFSIRYD